MPFKFVREFKSMIFHNFHLIFYYCAMFVELQSTNPIFWDIYHNDRLSNLDYPKILNLCGNYINNYLDLNLYLDFEVFPICRKWVGYRLGNLGKGQNKKAHFAWKIRLVIFKGLWPYSLHGFSFKYFNFGHSFCLCPIWK